MKGQAIISENLLAIGGLLISFVLIILVVQLVFSHQRQMSYELIFQSLARDIAIGIDRAGAAAGSILIEQEIPKGLEFDLKIDYKTVFITYDGKVVQNHFISPTHAGSQSFSKPEKLCIIKTRNDGRIILKEGSCSCDKKGNVCDPACSVVENTCNPKCYTNKPDNVCNPLCVKENDGTCDSDCYNNETDEVFDHDCISETHNPDGTCDPDSNKIVDEICDLDCFNFYKNGETGVCDPDCKKFADRQDGICYTGCVNETITTSGKSGAVSRRLILLKDGVCDPDCEEVNDICDPDCSHDLDCKEQCANLDENCESLNCCPDSKAVCCPGTNTCSLECCENGKCEGRDQWMPGNKIRWETAYTCSDCGTKSRPTCNSGGSFTSSACFHDTNQQDCNSHKPYWTPNVIEVCSESAKKFLDRRNWDIKEVAKTVVAATPEGWAFDFSRYFTIQNQNDQCGVIIPDKCFVQPASKTIEANEKYTSKAAHCCAIFSQTCCPSATAQNVGDMCKGVGFCGDHATAMLSILRTLGVPAKDVYSTFTASNADSRHAFVVYYCDPNLSDNLKLAECDGNWNEWLIVDATAHKIKPLRGSTECSNLCLWFNDADIYAKSEGKTGTTPDGKIQGKPFPSGIGCTVGPCCGTDGFCSQQNAECKM